MGGVAGGVAAANDPLPDPLPGSSPWETAGALVAAGISPAFATVNPAVHSGPASGDGDGVGGWSGTVPGSAGVSVNLPAAVARLRRAAARKSAGIRWENSASAGTISMQLNSTRERSFMVLGLVIWPAGKDRQ
jgi:hypothetical protein